MYAANSVDGISDIVPANGLFRQVTGDVGISRGIARSGVH
jgi:hypothetical protein